VDVLSDSPRVLLVGMMASGKSTVGRALAALTGWPYLDNDALVHEESGRPTPELLAATDETTLRRVEADALEEALAAEPPLVAGVAAGVVMDPVTRRELADGGFVVYLHAPLDLLVARVGDGSGRPWLEGDPAAALARLEEGRDPLYREVANLVLEVDGATPDELATRILDGLAAR
jgi:shikimate kinase